MLLDAAAPPAAPIAAGRRDRGVCELERQRAVTDLDADGPCSSAGREVAARVHDAGAVRREEVGRAVDGVPLADSAEVEANGASEANAPRDGVDHDLASARGAGRGTGSRLALDLLERAIVSGGDERVVNRRVEKAARAFARIERELRHRKQIRPCLDLAFAVQRGELRFGPETRERAFDARELGADGVERRARVETAGPVEQQFDFGPHRPELAVVDHEVLVIVSGGSVTTRTAGLPVERTGGAAAADARAAATSRKCWARACAISRRHAASRTWYACQRFARTRRTTIASRRRRCSRAVSAWARASGRRLPAGLHGWAATAAHVTNRTRTAMARPYSR